MIVGVLTCCILFHSVCDLKATQINVQHSQKFMFYKFGLDHIIMEATKNISVEGEDVVDHSTLTRGLKKLYSILQES